MPNPIPKNKPLRLEGAVLDNLYAEVKARDRYHCQYCFQWTLETPPLVSFAAHIERWPIRALRVGENVARLGIKACRIHLPQTEPGWAGNNATERNSQRSRRVAYRNVQTPARFITQRGRECYCNEGSLSFTTKKLPKKEN